MTGILATAEDGEERGSEWTYAFTVFTPTYNRASTLHRVFESLRVQTYRDFEWLVVDDGSTDGTDELVRGWAEAADFPIRFLRQENQGKHVAFNRAVREAAGELFLVLDSDDACVPEALERFHFHWESIPPIRREAFSAVTALCVDQQGRPVGDRFPRDVIDSTSLEMKYRFRVRGEKWGFHRTDVLRRFPYPEPKGEKYVAEDAVWAAISRSYFTRFVNEVLRIYHTGTGAAMNQLTNAAHVARYAGGLAAWHESILNADLEWFRYSPTTFLRSAIHYSRFSFHRQIAVGEQARKLRRPLGRLLWGMAVPVGLMLYRRDLRAGVRK
jgi:glycosyltransferase involved in cell wall biosynthesis